jgi:hypothetical protein
MKQRRLDGACQDAVIVDDVKLALEMVMTGLALLSPRWPPLALLRTRLSRQSM